MTTVRGPWSCDERHPSAVRLAKRRQRGLTLIETIVTIAVLTIGVVGIAAGVAATQKISGVTQSQAQLEVSIRQFSDWVRDSSSTTCTNVGGGCPSLPYTLCATVAGYQANVTKAISAGALTPVVGGETFTVSQVNLSTSGTRTQVGAVVPVAVPPENTSAVGPCSNPALCNSYPPNAGCVGDWGTQEIRLQVVAGGNKDTRVVWKSNGW